MATVDALAAFRLDGRVAIVTGASGALGDRFARVLAGAGAQVVVAARRKERLEALASEVPGVIPVGCDITDANDRDRLIDTATAVNGSIDVLVNNAGVGDPVAAEDETEEHFREAVEVNLTATFLLTQSWGRLMLDQRRGSCVNIASILGVVGVGQIPFASYAATKGAIVNLTRELAAQWARRGVRVNAIAPGWFPSEMTATMLAEDSGQKWVRQRTPLGRPGREDELDGALLFLAGDASSYVTGQVLAVDGGWTAV